MGTLDSEQVFLKWNNFENNMAAGFVDLLQHESMVDVTLAVDGKLVQAHKLVLSICSSYFRNIFQMNPCQHPIVILKDVGYQELSDLLQFMYRGEANVKQKDLPSFLRLAETLKVKGLAGSYSEMGLQSDNKKHHLDEDERRSSFGINPGHSGLLESREGVRDVTIKKGVPIMRKKRKRSISPMKAFDTKSKCQNDQYEAVKVCGEELSMENSYLNDIERVNIKEERLSDGGYDNFNEDIADYGITENILPPSSSKIGDLIPKAESGMNSRRASKPLSFIWSFFNFDCYKNKSECKLCGKVFKACPKTGTASVKYHLHFAHQILRTDGVVQ